jgi:cell filamentation protein
VNKFDITNQDALDEAETVLVSMRALELLNESLSFQISFASYCQLHKKMFGDLYEWAGCIRCVELAKKGTHFCPVAQIQEVGHAMFQRLAEAQGFRNQTKHEFVTSVAELYHDLNMLHPFREGNGRTQRLFFTLLIQQAGYCIDFSQCDTDALMMATIYAAQGVMDYLKDFFRKYIQ